mmetsp:Transcript_19412/g.41802  ORF Transcript_19412/g.41802 Transcript_19412/m.41802 type:complete len:254 (+) Transcript_19412:40-801(+)
MAIRARLRCLKWRTYCSFPVQSAVPILYEDRHVLAVNKPAGMLCQPDATGRPYIRAAVAPTFTHTYVVHRLDRRVSGCLLLARNKRAAARISFSFHERLVSKAYLAAVELRHVAHQMFAPGACGRLHLPSDIRVSLDFRVLSIDKQLVLLSVYPNRGMKHQVRRLLAEAAGCPIAGDRRYGAAAGPVLALHAATLQLPHPLASKPPLRVKAPLPAAEWSQTLPRALVMHALRALEADADEHGAVLWEPPGDHD